MGLFVSLVLGEFHANSKKKRGFGISCMLSIVGTPKAERDEMTNDNKYRIYLPPKPDLRSNIFRR